MAQSPDRGPVLALIEGARGRPDRVVMRHTDAVAPCLEGIALADDALATSRRAALAISAGSHRVALRELFRLSQRTASARTEFVRLAGLADRPPERAA